MRMHVIDVGQGSATLLEFPNAAVLVDTGGEQNAHFDSNAELDAYLDWFFAARPDLHGELASLVLTHPHLDHTRGVATVLAHHPPHNVVTNGQSVGSGADGQNSLRQYALDHQATVALREAKLDDIPPRGLTDEVIDPVHGTPIDPVITVLWGQVSTDPGWGEAFGNPRFTNCNNHCVVLRVDFGQASILITGDLESAALPDLVKRYQGTGLLDVDVYLVGHHGSANGTTPDLVAAMTPRLALISMGPSDREEDWSGWKYGHPRKEIVDMLEAGVSGMRAPVQVHDATDAKQFENRQITHAIYATGWDRSIVVELGSDGSIRVEAPLLQRQQISRPASAGAGATACGERRLARWFAVR
jgi:competence protein ComEC